MKWHGQAIDLVQRPSGGRAVLHQGDLTYSLITSGRHGRRRDIYADLCQFLITGWHSLGISLHLGNDQHSYQRSTNCFSAATAADLVMDNGYKMVGSAQLYRDRCILQHGSMRLTPDPALVEQVFGSRIQPPRSLIGIPTATIITALTTAAVETFQIDIEIQPLSQKEQQMAMAWAQAKICSADRS